MLATSAALDATATSLSVVPESPLRTSSPLSTDISNSHTDTPRPTGSKHRRSSPPGGIARGRPTGARQTGFRLKFRKGAHLPYRIEVDTACSASPPATANVARGITTDCCLVPAHAQLEDTASPKQPAPIKDPHMPSPYDVLQLDCFSVVPLYIPNWFVLALCYWHAEYNRDLFMALRSTPSKFCLHRCGSLWLDLERVWPEAYGDDSINDIDALEALPMVEDELMTVSVLIVNRYLTYRAQCVRYNRIYFLSPEGCASPPADVAQARAARASHSPEEEN